MMHFFGSCSPPHDSLAVLLSMPHAVHVPGGESHWPDRWLSFAQQRKQKIEKPLPPPLPRPLPLPPLAQYGAPLPTRAVSDSLAAPIPFTGGCDLR